MPPRIPRRLLPLKHPVPPPLVRALRSRGTPRPSQPSEQVTRRSGTSENVQPSSSGTPAQNETSQQNNPPPPPSMSNMLAQTNDADNPLLAPVHIPEDPNAVLKSGHPSTNLLAESGIVVQRQIEMMNVFLGFEQANRYVILDPHGNHIGYMAEHEGGIGRSVGRQLFRTHRAFTTNIFDRHGDEVLRFHRPFSYINSTIRVYDPLEPGAHSNLKLSSATAMQPATDVGPVHTLSQLPLDAMRIIGEAQSEWAPLRRKYALFLAHDLPSGRSSDGGAEIVPSATQSKRPDMVQFAYVNEPFLSWDFSLKSASDQLIGSVNRSFRGFAREIFTDTGSYALRMDSVGLEQEADQRHIVSQSHKGERAYAEALGSASKSGMTLDQRAVMLATAVTVDYDYFSRHSHGGGIMPLPFIMGGGGEGAAAGGAAAGAGAAEAGEVGAVVGGAGRAVGGATGAAGAGGIGEGAMAGAGTMAGYEAMQRGLGRDQPQEQQAPVDDASPQAPSGDYGQQQPYDYQSPESGFGGQDQGQDVWGGENDPWQGGQSAGGDGDEGGGLLSWLWDIFGGGD